MSEDGAKAQLLDRESAVKFDKKKDNFILKLVQIWSGRDIIRPVFRKDGAIYE